MINLFLHIFAAFYLHVFQCVSYTKIVFSMSNDTLNITVRPGRGVLLRHSYLLIMSITLCFSSVVRSSAPDNPPPNDNLRATGIVHIRQQTSLLIESRPVSVVLNVVLYFCRFIRLNCGIRAILNSCYRFANALKW